MKYEDIAIKYNIVPEIDDDLVYTGRVVLLKYVNTLPATAFIGAFKDEIMARNVALALEYYKEHNKA